MVYQNVIARAVPGADTFMVWYTLYFTAEEAEARNHRTFMTEIGEMLQAGDGHTYRVCGRDTRSRDLMMHPNGGYFINCQVMAERVGKSNLVPIGLVGRSIRVRRG